MPTKMGRRLKPSEFRQSLEEELRMLQGAGYTYSPLTPLENDVFRVSIYGPEKKNKPLTLDIAPGPMSPFGPTIEQVTPSGYRSVFGAEAIYGKSGDIPEFRTPYQAFFGHVRAAFNPSDIRIRNEPRIWFEQSKQEGTMAKAGEIQTVGGVPMYGKQGAHWEGTAIDFASRFRMGLGAGIYSEEGWSTIASMVNQSSRSGVKGGEFWGDPWSQIGAYAAWSEGGGSRLSGSRLIMRQYGMPIMEGEEGRLDLSVYGIGKNEGDILKRINVSRFGGERERAELLQIGAGGRTIQEAKARPIETGGGFYQRGGYRESDIIMPGETQARSLVVTPGVAMTGASPFPGALVNYRTPLAGQGYYGAGFKSEQTYELQMKPGDLTRAKFEFGRFREYEEDGEIKYERIGELKGTALKAGQSAIIGIYSLPDRSGNMVTRPLQFQAEQETYFTRDPELRTPYAYNRVTGEAEEGTLPASRKYQNATAERISEYYAEKGIQPFSAPLGPGMKSPSELINFPGLIRPVQMEDVRVAIPFFTQVAMEQKSFGMKVQSAIAADWNLIRKELPQVGGRDVNAWTGDVKEEMMRFTGAFASWTPDMRMTAFGMMDNKQLGKQMADYYWGKAKQGGKVYAEDLGSAYAKFTKQDLTGEFGFYELMMKMRAGVHRKENRTQAMRYLGEGSFSYEESPWLPAGSIPAEERETYERQAVQGLMLGPEGKGGEGGAPYMTEEAARARLPQFMRFREIGDKRKLMMEFRQAMTYGTTASSISPAHLGGPPMLGLEESAAIATAGDALARQFGLHPEQSPEDTGYMAPHVRAWRQVGQVYKYSRDPNMIPPQEVTKLDQATRERLYDFMNANPNATLEEIYKEAGGGQGMWMNEETGMVIENPMTMREVGTYRYNDPELGEYVDFFSKNYLGQGGGNTGALSEFLMGGTYAAGGAMGKQAFQRERVFMTQHGTANKLWAARQIAGSYSGRYGFTTATTPNQILLQMSNVERMIRATAKQAGVPMTPQNMAALRAQTQSDLGLGVGFSRMPGLAMLQNASVMRMRTPESIFKETGIRVPSASYITPGGRFRAGFVEEGGKLGSISGGVVKDAGDQDFDPGLVFPGFTVDSSTGKPVMRNLSEFENTLQQWEAAGYGRQEQVLQAMFPTVGGVPGGALNIGATSMMDMAYQKAPNQSALKYVTSQKLQAAGSAAGAGAEGLVAAGGKGISYNVRRLFTAGASTLGLSNENIAQGHSAFAWSFQQYLDMLNNPGSGYTRLERIMNTLTFSGDPASSEARMDAQGNITTENVVGGVSAWYMTGKDMRSQKTIKGQDLSRNLIPAIAEAIGLDIREGRTMPQVGAFALATKEGINEQLLQELMANPKRAPQILQAAARAPGFDPSQTVVGMAAGSRLWRNVAGTDTTPPKEVQVRGTEQWQLYLEKMRGQNITWGQFSTPIEQFGNIPGIGETSSLYQAATRAGPVGVQGSAELVDLAQRFQAEGIPLPYPLAHAISQGEMKADWGAYTAAGVQPSAVTPELREFIKQQTQKKNRPGITETQYVRSGEVSKPDPGLYLATSPKEMDKQKWKKGKHFQYPTKADAGQRLYGIDRVPMPQGLTQEEQDALNSAGTPEEEQFLIHGFAQAARVEGGSEQFMESVNRDRRIAAGQEETGFVRTEGGATDVPITQTERAARTRARPVGVLKGKQIYFTPGRGGGTSQWHAGSGRINPPARPMRRPEENDGGEYLQVKQINPQTGEYEDFQRISTTSNLGNDLFSAMQSGRAQTAEGVMRVDNEFLEAVQELSQRMGVATEQGFKMFVKSPGSMMNEFRKRQFSAAQATLGLLQSNPRYANFAQEYMGQVATLAGRDPQTEQLRNPAYWEETRQEALRINPTGMMALHQGPMGNILRTLARSQATIQRGARAAEQLTGMANTDDIELIKELSKGTLSTEALGQGMGLAASAQEMMKAAGLGGKNIVIPTAEELQRLAEATKAATKAVEDNSKVVEDNTTISRDSYKKMLDEGLKLIDESRAGRAAALRTARERVAEWEALPPAERVGKEIEGEEYYKNLGALEKAEYGDIKRRGALMREQEQVEDRLSMRDVSQATRRLIGGWGLFYMRSLMGMGEGVLGQGYQEAQQFRAQSAAEAQRAFGVGNIAPYTTPEMARQTALVRAGGTYMEQMQRATQGMIGTPLQDISGAALTGVGFMGVAMHAAGAMEGIPRLAGLSKFLGSNALGIGGVAMLGSLAYSQYANAQNYQQSILQAGAMGAGDTWFGNVSAGYKLIGPQIRYALETGGGVYSKGSPFMQAAELSNYADAFRANRAPGSPEFALRPYQMQIAVGTAAGTMTADEQERIMREWSGQHRATPAGQATPEEMSRRAQAFATAEYKEFGFLPPELKMSLALQAQRAGIEGTIGVGAYVKRVGAAMQAGLPVEQVSRGILQLQGKMAPTSEDMAYAQYQYAGYTEQQLQRLNVGVQLAQQTPGYQLQTGGLGRGGVESYVNAYARIAGGPYQEAMLSRSSAINAAIQSGVGLKPMTTDELAKYANPFGSGMGDFRRMEGGGWTEKDYYAEVSGNIAIASQTDIMNQMNQAGASFAEASFMSRLGRTASGRRQVGRYLNAREAWLQSGATEEEAGRMGFAAMSVEGNIRQGRQLSAKTEWQQLGASADVVQQVQGMATTVQGAILASRAASMQQQMIGAGITPSAEITQFSLAGVQQNQFLGNLLSGSPITIANMAQQMALGGNMAGARNISNMVVTDWNLAGQQTGLGWGTTSIYRPGETIAQTGQAIFGNIGQGSAARAAVEEGIRLPNGQLAGGERGLRYYMQQEGIKQQRAQMNNQLAMLALEERYTPLFWNIEDRQRALSDTQSQWGFQMQERQAGMQWRQTQEQFALQRTQQLASRQWTREDWAYQSNLRSMQWGWRQEDFQEEARFMTGRQRRIAERGMERETIMYGMEGEQIDKQRSRQKQQWQWEDEAFDQRKRHFEETFKLQEEDRIKQKEFYEEGKRLRDEQIKLQREYWKEQMELRKAAAGASKEYNENMIKANELMDAIGMAQQDAAGRQKLAMENTANFFKAMTDGLNWLIKHVSASAIAAMVENNGSIPYPPGGANPNGNSGKANPVPTAIGGPILAGRTGIVGEAGTEIVKSAGALSVIPNSVLKALKADAGMADAWSTTFAGGIGSQTTENKGPVTVIINLGNETLGRFVVDTVSKNLNIT